MQAAKAQDNQMNIKAIRGLSHVPNLREQSVSHYSKSILHENSNFMSMDKKNSVHTDTRGKDGESGTVQMGMGMNQAK